MKIYLKLFEKQFFTKIIFYFDLAKFLNSLSTVNKFIINIFYNITLLIEHTHTHTQ